MEKQKVLIDVYGCLKSVVPEYQTAIKKQDKMESKVEIILQNLRREDLNITLWGNVVRSFDVEAIQKHSTPVLVVFTSLRIAVFRGRINPSSTNHTCVIIDLEIPQREEYKKEFSKLGDKLKVLPNLSRQPTQEEAKNCMKKSISELNTLDPESYKNERVYCAGTIVRFTPLTGWWYKGCPTCYRHLRQREDNDTLTCTEHQQQIPLPCYRLYMTIEDTDYQATVILLGKQAEQIFGITCPELVSKTLLSNEESFPEEIENAVGDSYLFQLKFNKNQELTISAIYPPPEDYVVPAIDPSLSTSSDEKRRTRGTPRTLLKRIKRDTEEQQHQKQKAD